MLLRSNLFTLCWGIANIPEGICIARIGVVLIGAILAGIGVSAGVTLPMLVKGSGPFKDAPDVGSKAGLVVLGDVAAARFGRDKVLDKLEKKSGGFLGSQIMATIAGLLSCGIALAFVYGQVPIVAAMKARGAADIPVNFSVWAVGLAAGAIINVLFPAYLMIRNQSWRVLTSSWKELVLAAIPDPHLRGDRGNGPWDASAGSSGGVGGFRHPTGVTDHGRSDHGAPRLRVLMYAAIGIVILAATVMALGNGLAVG